MQAATEQFASREGRLAPQASAALVSALQRLSCETGLFPSRGITNLDTSWPVSHTYRATWRGYHLLQAEGRSPDSAHYSRTFATCDQIIACRSPDRELVVKAVPATP